MIPDPGDAASLHFGPSAPGSTGDDETHVSVDHPVASDLDGALSTPETTPANPSPPSVGCSIGLAVGLALGLPILYALLLLVEATRYIWTPVSIVLYSLVILVSLAILLATASSSRQAKAKNVTVAENRAAIVILAAIALLVSFSQLSKHLYVLFGGFSANNLGYWHWLRYGFANLFEGVLFDIPAIYNWGVSEIQPTAFWSQTLVFVFRTSLEFLIVVNILDQVRHARRIRSKPQQQEDKQTYFQFLIARIGGLLITVLWSIPTLIALEAIASDGLYIESSWAAIRLGAPVGFGMWLAWQSLRGVSRFSGLRNRLLALAGMLLGIWLLSASWPAFRDYLGL